MSLLRQLVRLARRAVPRRTAPAAPGSPSAPQAIAAQLRPLPYPFERYLTINSDCDGSVHDLIGAAVALNTVVREEYGLPICDSFFGKWLYECGLDGLHEPHSARGLDGEFDARRFFERCGEWVRGFHRGWFDTVHGWAYNMSVRVAPDIGTDADGLVVAFSAPPPWEEAAVPRYLALHCEAGDLRDVSRIALARDGAVLWSWEAPSQLAMDGAMADGSRLLPLPLAAARAAELAGGDLALVVDFSPDAGSSLRLTHIALVTEARHDLATQLDALCTRNLAVANFSSHAGGLVFAIPQGQRAQLPAAAYYSDEPVSAHYCVDLFTAQGFQTIQTFAQTSGYEVKSLADLTYERVLHDSTRVYDYHRYLCIPRDPKGAFDLSPFEVDGTAMNPSWADTAAMQIRYGLEQSATGSWLGAVIYTHLNYAAPTHPFMREGISARTMCNEALRAALGDLADRYFGLGSRHAPAERVFVAPSSVLVRMSAVSARIGERVTYDATSNTVNVSAVDDPVWGRRVPCEADAARDLHGLTFYVDDAHTATLAVDGRAVEGLVRSPADASGRQSITVIDQAAQVTVLGRVASRARELVADCDGVAWEIGGSDTEAGHRVRLDGAAGRVELTGPMPRLANRHYVAFEYTKSGSALRYAVTLVMEDGDELGWTETGAPAPASMLECPAWAATGRRIEILPLWRLCPAAALSAPPTSRIACVRIAVHGDPGDVLSVHRLALLRDDGKRGGRTRCFLGGSTGTRAPVEIVAQTDTAEHRAEILENGFYTFSEPVPRGSIVRLEGRLASGAIIAPLTGHWHEVVDDDWDIDFS